MKVFAVISLLASLAAQTWALTINTPTSVVQCQPVLLTWSDGTGPYFLSAIPGGQPTAAALKSFDSTDSTSITWDVDIAAGTSITLQMRDSTGTLAYSDIVTIQSSPDSSCVTTATTESGSGGATSGASTSTGAATGATTAAGSSTGTSSRASTATGSASSSTASSAAMRGSSMNAAGIAGVLGLVGAALL